MSTEMIDLNGHAFCLHRWGSAEAPPMLMLHGFPEYGGAWAALAAALPDWQCIAPDQRGYGQSWAPPEVAAYELRALVDDAAALIGRIGAPLPVVAHDWGAIVAYGLAIWRPELVSRLIVINGVHPGPFQREVARGGAQSAASRYIDYLRAEGAEERLSRDGFAVLRRLFAARMDMSWLSGPVLDAYLREWSRPGVLTGMLNWYRASPLQVAPAGKPLTAPRILSPGQGHVACPHLVVWGQDDTALLPACLDELDTWCADLTIERIAGADHWICHQKPVEVADRITRWMRRDTKAGSPG